MYSSIALNILCAITTIHYSLWPAFLLERPLCLHEAHLSNQGKDPSDPKSLNLTVSTKSLLPSKVTFSSSTDQGMDIIGEAVIQTTTLTIRCHKLY